MKNKRWTISALGFLAGALWLGGAALAAEPPAGSWGGNHVALNLGTDGGKLEYDCAHGTIDEALSLDEDNVFDVAGTHVREHGGPIHPDEQPDTHPARYLGFYDAQSQSLTLMVILTDLHRGAGTYHVKLGEPARIMKCL